jgi:hypothetical protein
MSAADRLLGLSARALDCRDNRLRWDQYNVRFIEFRIVVFSVTCVSAVSRGMVEANVQKTTEICSRPCSPETAGQTLVSLTVVLEMSHSATLDFTLSPVVRWSAPTTRFSRVTIRFMSRVAQSVCLATGWTTGRSRFDSRQRRKA